MELPEILPLPTLESEHVRLMTHIIPHDPERARLITDIIRRQLNLVPVKR